MPPPDEYIEYALCCKFNCLPSQLDQEDEDVINLFIQIIIWEKEKKDQDDEADKLEKKKAEAKVALKQALNGK